MMIFNILCAINLALGALFMLLYAHQVVYIIISLIKKPPKFADSDKTNSYAVLIAARNEENVIGQLCSCINNQDYPSHLVDIYVVADNCTDKTADVAREYGANVIERFNTEKIGKGYGLEMLFDHINDTVGYDAYDGYFIVDADNILEPNYITEMDKCFSAGNRMVIGYRNSKNYGDNWISAGYALWFYRSCRQLNGVRQTLGLSSEINGTGFLIHKDIIKRQGTWIHHLLIEDIEFTVDNLLQGESVAYCHDAILYDEQPTKFMTSWWQRTRWGKGYLQVLRYYGARLIKAFFSGKGFSNYDMLAAVSPAYLVTAVALVSNIVGIVIMAILEPTSLIPYLISMAVSALAIYVLFFAVGLCATVTEWDRIRVGAGRKIWGLFTFPLFMYTYIPIAVGSLFGRAQWKPIEHHPVDEGELEEKTGIGEREEITK
jgi:cellulose synthase/poly-beta-1,6-N-acetylglucosamine synthase-like glycosyltransferase